MVHLPTAYKLIYLFNMDVQDCQEWKLCHKDLCCGMLMAQLRVERMGIYATGGQSCSYLREGLDWEGRQTPPTARKSLAIYGPKSLFAYSEVIHRILILT